MKSLWVIVGTLMLGMLLAIGQEEPITLEEAASRPGERATLEGVVVEVARPENGYIYLNFGGKFPNQTFAGWIRPQETKNFPEIDAVSGRRVRVSGIASVLDGKVIIRLRKPSDLTILPLPES
jgi:hypothetical protein